MKMMSLERIRVMGSTMGAIRMTKRRRDIETPVLNKIPERDLEVDLIITTIEEVIGIAMAVGDAVTGRTEGKIIRIVRTDIEVRK